MSYILIIGLAREGKENLTTDEVWAAIRAQEFRIHVSTVFASDTAPTLVAEVVAVPPDLNRALRALSVELEQDCIAVYKPAIGKGQLIGPRADKRGEFNPEYFLLLDSTRTA